ncbi:MAG: type 4a pilus biogenesis protein PilO [Mycobacterium sp.]
MNFPPKTQREQIFLFVTILALGAGAAFYQYVWSPKEVLLAHTQTHVDSLDAMNQRAKAELAKGNVNDLRAQAARFQQNLELMRQLVPTGNEVPLLLEQVSTAARHVGLDIADIQPETPVPGELFDTYRYKLTVYGGYHDLAQFLGNVGSLTRIIAPVDLVLQSAQNPQAVRRSSHSGTKAPVQASLAIQTYVARTAGKKS